MEHEIIHQKIEKIKFQQKIAEVGVIKILITIPLTLETIGPWCRNKKIKNSKRFKFEKIEYFFKIANIKILKNIPLPL